MSTIYTKMIMRFIPRAIICGLRAIWINLVLRGQTRQSKDGICLDAKGGAVPWMTYPVIDFLLNLDLSECDVFEYGSGSSTLFFSQRCRSVVAVEHCKTWFDRMLKYSRDHLTIFFQPDLSSYPLAIEGRGVFDVVSIDGAERSACARAAVDYLKPGGVIILDNSEWYPKTASFLRRNGFTQIDFCGFSPLNSFPAMTSLFFRERMSIPYAEKRHGWVPIGGNPLGSPRVDD
jgi:hypothetical protein